MGCMSKDLLRCRSKDPSRSLEEVPWLHDCVSEITEKFVKLLKGIVSPVFDGHLFI